MKIAHKVAPDTTGNKAQSNKEEIWANSHTFGCNDCNFRAITSIQLEKHIKLKHEEDQLKKRVAPDTTKESNKEGIWANSHKFGCNDCDFRAITSIQLEKHTKVKHKDQLKKGVAAGQICRFWLTGFCRNGDQCRFDHPIEPFCRNGNNCAYLPNCKFSHSSGKQPCYFQTNCRKVACQFEYFDLPFLGQGQKYNQEFPPPRPANVWRQW